MTNARALQCGTPESKEQIFRGPGMTSTAWCVPICLRSNVATLAQNTFRLETLEKDTTSDWHFFPLAVRMIGGPEVDDYEI